LLLDPAKRVRLAAARAAAEARDPSDEASLFEAARLDPSPEVRHAAITAIGSLGGRHALLGLRDLWPTADTATRSGILGAWTQLAAVEAERGATTKARAMLRWVAERESGATAVRAALAVIAEATPSTADAIGHNAAAILARAVAQGSSHTRMVAIDGAPLSWPSVVTAIREATEAHDQRVAVAALARLSELNMSKMEPAERDKLRLRLLEFARGGGVVASRARVSLAELGDVRAVKLMAAALKSLSWLDRAEAATHLVALGRIDKALPALADPHAYVRARAACAILSWRGDAPPRDLHHHSGHVRRRVSVSASGSARR
jgi:HEAT repeat protein